MIDRDAEEAFSREALETSARIAPLLAGREPSVQGAALADLLAIWLSGHRALDEAGAIDRAKTDDLRGELLAEHLRVVKRLVAANDADEEDES